MQTLRQICSDLATDIKSLNLDDRLSFRYLANKFKDKIAYFLRQEARSREIVKAMGAWKTLDCIELEDAPKACCPDVPELVNLRRSIKEIPEAYNTNYGVLIKVLTIGGKELKHINSFDYNDYINREYAANKEVFWLQDKRIYIPNSCLDLVTGVILAKDPLEVDKFNGKTSACVSPLDGQIDYTDYLIMLAKTEVLRDLGIGKTVVEDEKGDDNTNRK